MVGEREQKGGGCGGVMGRMECSQNLWGLGDVGGGERKRRGLGVKGGGKVTVEEGEKEGERGEYVR